MADLDQLLDLTEEVLQDCRRNFSSEYHESTDRTLFYLECCRSLLSAYVSGILYVDPSSGSCGVIVTQLRDFAPVYTSAYYYLAD